MPPLIYGSGLYGSGVYGRAGAGLVNAQAVSTRETGLQVIVLNEQVNAWEHHHGTHAFPDTGLGYGLYQPINDAAIYEVGYFSYRGLGDMAVKANGNIVRVRNGDPADANDRQIWSQTITDPENLAQWASWSVLYSGTHYGPPSVVIQNDGTTVTVYHCKSDGLYRNNSKIVNNFGLANKCLAFKPMLNSPNAGILLTIEEDSTDGKRLQQFYFIADTTSASVENLPFLNNDWKLGGILTALDDDAAKVHGIMSAPLHYSPRSTINGSELAYFNFQLSSFDTDQTPFFPIRGIGGGAGINYLSGTSLIQMSDGYYYIFGTEIHQYQAGDITATSTLGSGLPMWMRSKDLMHWTDPMIGPPITRVWGSVTPVESNGYLYAGDHEVIWRRPVGQLSYDITDYVPKVEFDLPRDNQVAAGTITVANPDGVNDFLKGLSNREIVIAPGIKLEDGTYEYVQYDRFFIDTVTKETKGKVNRLQIAFSNVWQRLDNPFRDVTNFVGQLVWDDFASGKRNQPFNYFFVSDSSPSVDSFKHLHSRGMVLATMWKGTSFDCSIQFHSYTGNPMIIAHYRDKNNYMKLQISGTTLILTEVVNGDSFNIDTASISATSSPHLRLEMRFGKYRAWVDGVLKLDDAFLPLGSVAREPGYVGFYATTFSISNFHLDDWEYPLTMADLIRTALSMGDFHDVIVTGGEERAVAITWGPQVDLSTPAAALASALEASGCQLAWRNGIVEVGKFNDQTPVHIIENQIIESDEIDEAGRRVNIVAIDGNEHWWLEVDIADLVARDSMITAYYDLPELLDRQAVIDRAREEMKRAALGDSPGGTTPLYFDLWRMDAVTWVDNAGNSHVVRIEGFKVQIEQGPTPSQRQTFDTSLFTAGSSDGLMDSPPE